MVPLILEIISDEYLLFVIPSSAMMSRNMPLIVACIILLGACIVMTAAWGGLSPSPQAADVQQIFVRGAMVVSRPLEPQPRVVLDYAYTLKEPKGIGWTLDWLNAGTLRRDLTTYLTQDCSDALFVEFTNQATLEIAVKSGKVYTYMLSSPIKGDSLSLQGVSNDYLYVIGLKYGSDLMVTAPIEILEVICKPLPSWVVLTGEK